MTRTPFEPGKGMPEKKPFDAPYDSPFDATTDAFDASFAAVFGTAPAAPDDGDGPPSLDELSLRRLLHDAVRDVEPRTGALDRLARAVPARRARRRQAMVGAAAGVLLFGTAVPALLHLATGHPNRNGAVQASGGLTPGSTPGTLGGELPGDPSGRTTTGTGTLPTTGRTGGASAAASMPAIGDTPACSRQQLGDGTAHTDAPDAQGKVYGTFSVVNVSSTPCAVVGAAQLAVTAQGATEPGSIQVADHTTGDPATALPDPANAPAAVVLPPGQAYQVDFAWVPATAGDGVSGCVTDTAPPADPTGGDSSGTTGTGGDAGGTGTDSTGGTSNSGLLASSTTTDSGGATAPPSSGDDTTTSPPDDGISLASVPPGGGPAAATASIPGACAGTVYQTTPLPTA
jgi:hypothetical protein